MRAWTAFKLALFAGATITMLWHWQVVEAQAAVPEAVVESFQRDGGYVEYVDTVCTGADGTYTDGRKRIQIRNGAPENVLPHEYGHYVYCSTVNRWDAEHREKMAALYGYYRDKDRRCYTENETFAVLYAEYCTGQTGGDVRELMEYATDLLTREGE